MPYVGKKPADIIATAVDTTTGTFSGDIDASTVNATGDTAAGDNAAIGFTSAEGLILTGQGSTSDITVKNDADATVFTVPTGTDDILFPDNAKAMFGASSDLQIYHTSGFNQIETSNGPIQIKTSSENMIKAIPDGAIELYHNNVKRIETTSSGATITGAITATSGNVTITDGNLVVASGHGIDFSATSGSGSSELLDDYETGTFTPTATNATGYVVQAGHYTKVGNQVTCVFNIEISGVSSNGNQVLGLPFTPALSSGQSSGYVGVMYFANLANNFISLGGYVVNGENKINFSGAASAAATIQFNGVNVWSQSGSRILATVTYLVA